MTTEHPTNPHDRLFREAFSRKEMAEGFIAEYLPQAIGKQVDFKTLEIIKDSYIDKELNAHYSDILYKISLAGKPAFIYLLFEHKSYSDRLIAFQLLRNMVKIWEQYFKQNKHAKKLPCVVPLVIYHGKAQWKIKEGLKPLFNEIAGTEQYIPDFHYELFDISHIPGDNIKGTLLIKAFLLLLRSSFDPQQFETLPKIFELLNKLSKVSKATEYIELFIRYLVSTVESGKEKDLTRVITKSLKDGGTTMPTIAEKWLQEGIEKGIEKRDFEIVEKMLLNNMSTADIRKITGMSLSKIEQVRKRVKKSK